MYVPVFRVKVLFPRVKVVVVPSSFSSIFTEGAMPFFSICSVSSMTPFWRFPEASV